MIDFTLSNKFSDDYIVSNDLVCLLQQIDLLFSTNVNDVLGDTTFGSNYDKYLYTLGMSNVALENKIKGDLNKLDKNGYSIDVKVSIVEGSVRDIAFIDITISDDYENYNKTYIIK